MTILPYVMTIPDNICSSSSNQITVSLFLFFLFCISCFALTLLISIVLFAFVFLCFFTNSCFVLHFIFFQCLLYPFFISWPFVMSFHFHLLPFPSSNPPALTATAPPHSSRLVSPIKAQRVGAQVSLCPLMWAHWAKQRTNPAQPRGGVLPVLPRWFWPWL